MLAGCATTAQMKAAAVANQPIVVNAGKQAARDAVAQAFVSQGYMITKDSDFVLQFSAPTSSAMVQLLLSSGYDSRVEARITVQFVGDNPTTVSWRAAYVTNPGSAFERLTDVSNGADAPMLQGRLQAALAPLQAK